MALRLEHRFYLRWTKDNHEQQWLSRSLHALSKRVSKRNLHELTMMVSMIFEIKFWIIEDWGMKKYRNDVP